MAGSNSKTPVANETPEKPKPGRPRKPKPSTEGKVDDKPEKEDKRKTRGKKDGGEAKETEAKKGGKKGDGGVAAAKVSLGWEHQPKLTDTMLDIISSNDKYRTVLFPAVGKTPSTTKGGGMYKTDAHYLVCKELVAHEEGKAYREAFALATSAQARSSWGLKIKNRLKDLQTEFRQHRDTLGSTGKGIENEDLIDLDDSNEWVNLWKQVKGQFPWFFDMRDLVGERPNLHTVGLISHSGNIGTAGSQEGEKAKGGEGAGSEKGDGDGGPGSPLDMLTPSEGENSEDDEPADGGRRRKVHQNTSSSSKKKKFSLFDLPAEDEEDSDVVEVDSPAKEKAATPKSSAKGGKNKPPGITDLLAQDAVTRQLSQKNRIARSNTDIAHTQADIAATGAKKAAKLKTLELHNADHQRRFELEMQRVKGEQQANLLRLQNEQMRMQMQMQLMHARNGAAEAGGAG
ncbi:hypothetical protein PENSPDRAFT_694513 [Peniophora sp. CONT]|nr:hypothetical protein PENSPDRAFT_694513 [Peniophora sp. CONT]